MMTIAGYFDFAATTPPDSRILEELLPLMISEFGNPASIHPYGQAARDRIEKARNQVATAVSADAEQIIFTSGATEGNNTVLFSSTIWQRGSGHIVATAIEHPCILEPLRALEQRGFEVSLVPPESDGRVDPDRFLRAVRRDTIFATAMLVNNETGVIQPVKAIGAALRARGIYFHCDAVQALGKVPIDASDIEVDSLSFSAHKVYGLKGNGALFVREPQSLVPLVRGGGQERNLRSGTENLPGIATFGAVADRVDDFVSEGRQYSAFKDILMSALSEAWGVAINGSQHHTVPHILNLTIPGVRSDTLATALGIEGFAVSTGSACGARKHKLSHVLTAMGLKPEDVRGSIRISFGHGVTTGGVEALRDAILKLLPKFAEAV